MLVGTTWEICFGLSDVIFGCTVFKSWRRTHKSGSAEHCHSRFSSVSCLVLGIKQHWDVCPFRANSLAQYL